MAAVATFETPPLPRRLHIGIFADAPLQPRWAVEALARVAASDFAVVSVLAVAGAEVSGPLWFVRVYGRIDRLAFGADPSGLVPLVSVPHLRRLAAFRRDDLAGLELDVAFALGEVDCDALRGVARYGVWRFVFSAGNGDSPSFAGFREVARGEPLTGSGVAIELPSGERRYAYHAFSRTYPYSVARTRAQVLARTGDYAGRALDALHRQGAHWLDQCPPAPALREERHGHGKLALDLARIGGRLASHAWTRALHLDQWFLAFRFGAGVTADLAGFTRLMPPRDRGWADPFVIERGGRYFVFLEELPYRRGRAHIAVMEIAPDGRCTEPVPVLERDYHLSYPFVFEDEGVLYMLPESSAHQTLELYRCVEFPRRWRLERVLLEGVRCVDATLHRADGRWWLFTSMAPGDSPCYDDELHLFHAEQLAGPWTPHPSNPIVRDPRGARPAGALYRHGDALYRPAQMCVPRYGAGLVIQQVLRLTPEHYAERELQRIVPRKEHGLLGLHTLNRAGELTVVDAFIRRSRLGSRRSAIAGGGDAGVR